MYRKRRIGIFIPALNEERLIGVVLKKIPKYVDRVIVIDDASTDKTSKIVELFQKKDKRIALIKNKVNKGSGYAAKTAFKQFLKEKIDLFGPIAGDDQLEPKYLPKLLDPIIDNECDFTKGNRFLEKPLYKKMPFYRYIGNIVVTIINKFATGYYQMFDSTNGYWIVSLPLIKRINIDELGDRYEIEMTIWLQLNIINARTRDISIPAIYKDEKSKIRFWSTSFRTLDFLFKGFFKRIFYRYIFYNFSPIGLFFISGLIFFLSGTIYGLWIIIYSLQPNHIPATTATVMLSVVPFIVGFQLLLQAIVLDIQNEPK